MKGRALKPNVNKKPVFKLTSANEKLPFKFKNQYLIFLDYLYIIAYNILLHIKANDFNLKYYILKGR